MAFEMPKLDIKITQRFNNWQQTINSAIYPMTYCVRMKKFNKTMSLIYQFCKYIAENAKTMLITNFPIYWSCDELADLFVTMYSHRTLGFHVHSAMTDFSGCTLLLWADNLVQFFFSTVSTVFTDYELYVLKKAIILYHSWNIGSKVEPRNLIYIFHFIQHSGSVLLHAVTEHYLASRLHLFGVLLSLFHTIN